MESLIGIQGKVIKVEPAKTIGYYITIRDQSTGKRQGAFSQWELQEKAYTFTLRQDGKFFFIVSWQELISNLNPENKPEKAIHQSYKIREVSAEQELIHKLQTKIKQLETENQQWKNSYHNQKQILKEAQRIAYKNTIETKITAIQSKPGKKSKLDLDYLKLLNEFSQECQRNWVWLNAD